MLQVIVEEPILLTTKYCCYRVLEGQHLAVTTNAEYLGVDAMYNLKAVKHCRDYEQLDVCVCRYVLNRQMRYINLR